MKRILENIHIAKVDFSTRVRQKIKDTWREKIDIPFKPNVYCDHVTLAYQPDELLSAYIKPLAGLEVEFHVTGWAADFNGQVMTGYVGDPVAASASEYGGFECKVEKARRARGIWEGRPLFHVTVSTANGFPPVYSNQLIADSREAGTHWGRSRPACIAGFQTWTGNYEGDMAPVIATFAGTIGITWNSRTE